MKQQRDWETRMWKQLPINDLGKELGKREASHLLTSLTLDFENELEVARNTSPFNVMESSVILNDAVWTAFVLLILPWEVQMNANICAYPVHLCTTCSCCKAPHKTKQPWILLRLILSCCLDLKMEREGYYVLINSGQLGRETFQA